MRPAAAGLIFQRSLADTPTGALKKAALHADRGAPAHAKVASSAGECRDDCPNPSTSLAVCATTPPRVRSPRHPACRRCPRSAGRDAASPVHESRRERRAPVAGIHSASAKESRSATSRERERRAAGHTRPQHEVARSESRDWAVRISNQFQSSVLGSLRHRHTLRVICASE